MEQPVLIRKAKEEDVFQIQKLANQLSETISVSESYLHANFSRFLENEEHCLFVAVQNEIVVGYVSGYFHDAIYASGPVAYVDEIVVDATARTMRTGSQLMAHFEEAAKKKGCLLVSLATYGAKGFYETLGYTSKAGYFKKYLR